MESNYYLKFDIPGIEIFIAFIIITFIGWLSLSFLGKKIIEIINKILKKIPILRTIYSVIGQMTDQKIIQSLVLIEFINKHNGKTDPSL